MAIGRSGAGPKDGAFATAPHDGGNSLAPSPPPGALRNPTSLYKTLLLVNLPITITIIFNKTYFINKNILEITNKFISSNQTNF